MPISCRRLRFVAAGVIPMATVLVTTGCGAATEKSVSRACVVLDVSHSAEKNFSPFYGPGFAEFALHRTKSGNGRFCFVVAADQLLGGDAAWADLSPSNPDAPTADVEIRNKVAAATAQLAGVERQPGVSRGGSRIVEGIAAAARGLSRGDAIFILSDGIQNSGLLGDFTLHRVDLSDAGITKKLDQLSNERLLPDLQGIELIMPFLFASPTPLHMGQRRRNAIEAFWRAYARRTGAIERFTDRSNEPPA